MLYIGGDSPLMPIGADPLPKEEVDLIRRWILEGALTGSAAQPAGPPEGGARGEAALLEAYEAPPLLPSLAFSPDGKYLAAPGYHEILVHRADGSGLVARLPGRAERIQSIAFSGDGQVIAAVGGTPSQFGEIQFWSVKTWTQIRAIKVSHDTLYGASFSPDGKRLAFGGSDKKAYIAAFPFGQILVEFENHDDWVFATAFTTNGKHFVTGSRDRALKLVEADTGSFVDDINASNKGYGPVLGLDRHPGKDWVVMGGEDEIPKLYQVYRTQKRDRDNTDFNLIRAFPRVEGGINAVRFSPDGSQIAAGGINGELHLFDAGTGERTARVQADEVSLYSLAYHPSEPLLAAGGFEGIVRMYNPENGELVGEWVPVPMKTEVADAK